MNVKVELVRRASRVRAEREAEAEAEAEVKFCLCFVSLTRKANLENTSSCVHLVSFS